LGISAKSLGAIPCVEKREEGRDFCSTYLQSNLREALPPLLPSSSSDSEEFEMKKKKRIQNVLLSSRSWSWRWKWKTKSTRKRAKKWLEKQQK
jgi:hypothetical protein